MWENLVGAGIILMEDLLGGRNLLSFEQLVSK